MEKRKITIRTPVAILEVDLIPQGITQVRFHDSDADDPGVQGDCRARTVLEQLVDQVQDWFQSYFRTGSVSYKPLLFPRGTTFQRVVWTELRSIPPGETRTYGDVAKAIGKPRAAQAVGQACGQNPLPILIPCHRVVPAGSGPGGYTGPEGIKTKLLEHEVSVQSI